MIDYLYSENDVRKMWERSYSEQIGVSQAKCLEAIVRTNGKLYVAFSGGKDSAVLLYLMGQLWATSIHKSEPLKVMNADTSNEFLCMQSYVVSYCKYIEKKFDIIIDLHIVRGEKNYVEVTDLVGMPFISKKVSRIVRDCKKDFKKLGLRYEDIIGILPRHYTEEYYIDMLISAKKLRELGFSDTVILNLTKITSQNYISNQRFLSVQYRPLIDANFELSEECCKYLKKDPVKYASKELGGLLPVVGEMACDSQERLNAYRQTGCNMFDGNNPKSKPLGAATEQTILHFIYDKKIPCSPVYGECIYDKEDNLYKFTGEQRTGCKLCGFGLKFDPDRFIRLQKYEPATVNFAFTSRERGGLGYTEICKFLNEYCGMKIVIPEIEQGYYEKRVVKNAKE